MQYCLPRRKVFRPRLECLEARDCPAAFFWTGAVNSDWFMPVNWADVVGQPQMTIPTQADDVYLLGSVSNADCDYIVNTSAPQELAHSITLSDGYTGKLTLNNNNAAGLMKVVDDVWLQGDLTSELRLGQSNTLEVGDLLRWERGNIDLDTSNNAAIDAARIELYGSDDRTTGASITAGVGAGGNSHIYMVSGTAQGLLKLDKGAVLENQGGTLYHEYGTIDNTNHNDREASLVKNAEGATWVHQTASNVTVSVGFLNEGTLKIEAGTYAIDDVSTTAQPTYGLKQVGDNSVLSITDGATLRVTDGADAGKVLIGGGEITTDTVTGGASAKLLTNNGTTAGEVTFKDTKIRLGGTAAGGLDLGISDAILSGTTDFQLTAPTISGGDTLWTEGNISLVGNNTKLTVNFTGNDPASQTSYNVLHCTGKNGDFGTKTRNTIKVDLGGWEQDGEDLTWNYRIYFNP